MKTKSSKPSVGLIIVWSLALVGIALMAYRFLFGLGAVTNLSDGYPWGWWIGIDILMGIALASGGFVLAGVVHIFGREKYHALVRPAILTAMLGYILFITGLLVDLGRPWSLWRALFWWNHDSPMFEVAWCVMLYTTVLILEFVPAVFERWSLTGLHKWWRALVPWVVVGMLSIFTLAMTGSVVWVLAVFTILVLWEVLMIAGIMPRDKQMPLLLIMAGVIFSTLHQSSLGSLFLLAEHSLHPLWFTPIIPIIFLLSAIMAAPAMVTFEAIVSERTLKHPARVDLLGSLARWMPFLLGIYFVVRIGDLVARGALAQAFAFDTQGISFLLEIGLGVLLPFVLVLMPAVRASKAGLLWTSIFVIVGIILHRLNVAVIGIHVPGWETYVPMWSEIFITVGIFSIGLIVFRWAMLNLPIVGEHVDTDHAGSVESAPASVYR